MSRGASATEVGPPPDPRLALRNLPVRGVIGGALGIIALPIFVLVLAFLGGELLATRPYLALLPVAGAGALTLAVAFPRWIIPAMMAILIAFPLTLDEVSLPLGFMRLYFSDLLLLALGTASAVRLSRTGWSIPVGSLPTIFLVWIALGFVALVNGYLVMGHEFDRAFGDFRRAVVCLGAMIGFLVLYGSPRDRNYLLGGLIAGCLIILVEGFLQVVTGQFYTRRFTDAAHILTKFELQFLAFGILFAVARLVGGQSRAIWILLVVAGGVLTLLGNFRSTWLSLLGGLLYIFLYLPARWRLVMVGYGSVLAVVGAMVLGLLWNVPVADGGSTLGEDLLAKTSVSSARYDPNVTWRLESYANAIQLWKQSPVWGQGLGVLTEFSAPTSTGGAQLVRGHRVHNSFLWILMTFGVLGAAVFGGWLLTVFSRFHRAIVGLSPRDSNRGIVIASGAFLVSFLISTSFEIFLESAPPVMMLAAVLALGSSAAATAHHGPLPKKSPETPN